MFCFSLSWHSLLKSYVWFPFPGIFLGSSEWLKSDGQRTAMGLDLDEEAIRWGIRENFLKHSESSLSRMCFVVGNVLDNVSHGKVVSAEALGLPSGEMEASSGEGVEDGDGDEEGEVEGAREVGTGSDEEDAESAVPAGTLRESPADIVCAFNFSVCCLHSRSQLLRYFSQVKSCMSGDGGIFAMDLYGGFSSEGPLKLKRTFPNFVVSHCPLSPTPHPLPSLPLVFGRVADK